MKTKKFSKKLILNKKTVSNLNLNAMTAIKAGQLGTSNVDPEACGTQQTFLVCTNFTECIPSCWCTDYFTECPCH